MMVWRVIHGTGRLRQRQTQNQSGICLSPVGLGLRHGWCVRAPPHNVKSTVGSRRRGIWYSLCSHCLLYALESPNTKFYATVHLSSARWPGGIDGLGVLHFMTHCKFLLGRGQWGSDGTLTNDAPCPNASLRDSSKTLSNFFFFEKEKKKKKERKKERSALSHLSHWVIF